MITFESLPQRVEDTVMISFAISFIQDKTVSLLLLALQSTYCSIKVVRSWKGPSSSLEQVAAKSCEAWPHAV